MKILIIQERGRHEKNREFREALCMKRSLERAGHECIVWGLNYDNFSMSFDEISKGCDAVLSLENYDSGWHPDISSFRGIKLFWSIDSHCALEQHKRHCKVHKFDVLLMSNIHHKEHFSGLVGDSIWFPNGYPSDLVYPDTSVKRFVDVGFCGSLIGSRELWLNSIGRKFPIQRDIFKIGSEMVQALSSYKIAFNINIGDDINYRTFEATGAGAMLLTNYTPNIEFLFDVGNDIVIYTSMDDLLNKIEYYLMNDDERLTIAKSGYEKSSRLHTYDKRIEQLLEIIM